MCKDDGLCARYVSENRYCLHQDFMLSRRSSQLRHFIRTVINIPNWVSYKLRTLPAKLHDDLSSLEVHKSQTENLRFWPSAMVMRASNCSVDLSVGSEYCDYTQTPGYPKASWRENFAVKGGSYSSPPRHLLQPALPEVFEGDVHLHMRLCAHQPATK